MVRPVPGWSQDNHRRRCLNEIETLAHVLGSCTFGETVRISRHHRIHLLIAQALQEKHLNVHEEVPGIADNGGTRRVDIIAITPDASAAVILDPTVRFETYADQPIEVNLEKRNIYLPTIPYYKKKYKLQDINVIGLMTGARGTILAFF